MNARSRPRLVVTSIAVAALAAAAGPVAAVSDGGYDPAKQGCSPTADDSAQPDHTEEGCYAATLQLSGAQHRYVLVGIPQTADGEGANAVDLCLDFTGTATCARFDQSGVTPLPDRPGTPPDPEQGELHVYFGADDNLDEGEHDGSTSIGNGPSDGGSIIANVAPLTAVDWLAQAMGGDTGYVLTHPLPGADAGTGACADGICISVQTQRRVAYEAGHKNAATRDAADYDGHEWDPETCAGPSDTKDDCGGHAIAWWHKKNQTTYVEPGIQIYEDPDPQASPAGPYPLPALYVGTCGFVAGGGVAPPFPASPFTNDSGQIVVETGC